MSGQGVGRLGTGLGTRQSFLMYSYFSYNSISTIFVLTLFTRFIIILSFLLIIFKLFSNFFIRWNVAINKHWSQFLHYLLNSIRFWSEEELREASDKWLTQYETITVLNVSSLYVWDLHAFNIFLCYQCLQNFTEWMAAKVLLRKLSANV